MYVVVLTLIVILGLVLYFKGVYVLRHSSPCGWMLKCSVEVFHYWSASRRLQRLAARMLRFRTVRGWRDTVTGWPSAVTSPARLGIWLASTTDGLDWSTTAPKEVRRLRARHIHQLDHMLSTSCSFRLSMSLNLSLCVCLSVGLSGFVCLWGKQLRVSSVCPSVYVCVWY